MTSSSSTPQNPASGPRGKVLLIENGLANQKLALGLLNRWGFSVTVATDEAEATTAMEQQPIDLVLMDVEMVGFDAFETTRLLRELESVRGKRIPIVGLATDTGVRQKCLEANMNGCISKPLRRGELESVLATPLASNGRRPAPPNGEESLVDWGCALEAVQGDRTLLREILESIRVELPQLVGKVRLAIDREDASELRRVGHTIRGSLRIFGVNDASRAAKAIEASGMERSFDSIESRYELLQKNIDRLVAELCEFKV